MENNDSRFPEQKRPEKLHGDSRKEADPQDEGNVKEWQDRARVVLDAKEAVQHEASPNQSPVEGNRIEEDVEEKSEKIKNNEGKNAGY